jgi:hypothetical protein
MFLGMNHTIVSRSALAANDVNQSLAYAQKGISCSL